MSPGDSTVLFRALPIRLRFSKEDQRSLAEFAIALSQTVAGGRPFTCLVTSDAALRKLNLQFLSHDYPTDVLSFPVNGPAQEGCENPTALGELAISAARARAQALEFGHSCIDEIRVLMLHGVLHLLGFDHEADRGQMARVERKWRRHFELPFNLIARSSALSSPRRAKVLARHTTELSV